MKTIIKATALLLLITNVLFAQSTRLVTSGVIEFDKNVNVYGLIKQQVGKNPDEITLQRIEQYKKVHPQFRILKSTLTFNKDKALFVPLPSVDNERILGDDNPMATQSNTIFTDFIKQTSITQKTIYEENFLIRDSLRKIKWKITDETREIAGYTCRRANALVLDSVYVVAYYTNDIAVSGGPESFTGLPGMILGVALPHENAQWFASKVTDTTVPAGTIVPPKKGKQVTYKQLLGTLKTAMKDWGRNGPYEMKIFSL
jgi:GLPGLI family protein